MGEDKRWAEVRLLKRNLVVVLLWSPEDADTIATIKVE
jgi:hypothetical protein